MLRSSRRTRDSQRQVRLPPWIQYALTVVHKTSPSIKSAAPATESNRPTKPPVAEEAPAPSDSGSHPQLLSSEPGPSARPTLTVDEDEDEPEYDPDDEDFEFPISHELPMKDHTKVVTALAADPSGARFVSGSHDYDCKLWDFGGMTASVKPFKTWEPAGTYYVRSYAETSFLGLT